jgi:hypothetical protein
VDTKQYTLSSYGALELSNKGSIEAVLGRAIASSVAVSLLVSTSSNKGSIEAVLGVAKATHKVGKSNTPSADQGSNGFFASIVHTYIKGSKIKLSLICPCPVVSTNHHLGTRPSTVR